MIREMRKPEMTKKMSTPTKPPGSQARSAWKMTTPRTASARNPLMSALKSSAAAARAAIEVRRFEGFVQHVGPVARPAKPDRSPRRRKSPGDDRQAAAGSLALAAQQGPYCGAHATQKRAIDPDPLRKRARESRPQVALFRERKDANASAARLRRLGFSVACLPVIEIRTRPVQPQRSHYDAVVATSDKAFHDDGPLDTSSPLYVVGARTGRAAAARGWRLASPPAPDADDLSRR